MTARTRGGKNLDTSRNGAGSDDPAQIVDGGLVSGGEARPGQGFPGVVCRNENPKKEESTREYKLVFLPLGGRIRGCRILSRSWDFWAIAARDLQ